MKILVIGSKGRQGKRYSAILRYLKEDVVEADIGDKWWKWDYDRAIIATPTQNHFSDLVMSLGKPTLCEKPITKVSAQLLALMNTKQSQNIRMVSNWLYAVNRVMLLARGPEGKQGALAVMDEMAIEYKSFQTGEDGLFWDCIQIIYMAGRFRWGTDYPSWSCTVDGNPVTLEDIQDSYVVMVSDWLYSTTPKLWTLKDAVKANQKVEWALKHYQENEQGEIDFRGMA